MSLGKYSEAIRSDLEQKCEALHEAPCTVAQLDEARQTADPLAYGDFDHPLTDLAAGAGFCRNPRSDPLKMGSYCYIHPL